MKKCNVCKKWNKKLFAVPFNNTILKVCSCECFLIQASRYYDQIIREEQKPKPKPKPKQEPIPLYMIPKEKEA